MTRLKTHRKASFQRSVENEKYRMDSLLKDFLATLTEASYQVAVKCGFRGSFVVFLSDFQEALETVIGEVGENPKFRRYG
jgi:hypothetical protein